MGKGLDQYPEEDRERIATRRVKDKTRGIGYWGAVDYLTRRGKNSGLDPLRAEQIIDGVVLKRNKPNQKGKKNHANPRRPIGPTLSAALDEGSKRRLEALRAQ